MWRVFFFFFFLSAVVLYILQRPYKKAQENGRKKEAEWDRRISLERKDFRLLVAVQVVAGIMATELGSSRD